MRTASFRALLLAWLHSAACALPSLSIDTKIGTIRGFIDESAPDTAQFLGIPYAEPPVDHLRWLPAVPKRHVGHWDALKQSPACPQAEPSPAGGWPAEFLIKPNSTSEDCLHLNVWAPYVANHQSKDASKQGSWSGGDPLLPVVVWIHGGALVGGGGDIAYQIPTSWVQRSRKHIVVGVNYRLGLFGFPNAGGLNPQEQNLGLLDQRRAIEWVRDNIASFGGDPEQITLWGQSAGAASIAYYHYTYPDDPIAAGMIQDSGSVFLPMGSDDKTHSTFTALAIHFGCGGANTTIAPGSPEERDCLLEVPFLDLQSYVDTSGLSFNVVVDEKTKFSDYAARSAAGDMARMPTIIGTNRDESYGVPSDSGHQPVTDTLAPDSTFACPANYEAALRTIVGYDTWRYLYSGNFSNISPSGSGAYHSSELPLIFGTHGIVRGTSTEFEVAVSHKMQDLWLAFIQDPIHGLERHGWKKTAPGGLDTVQTGVDFGHDGVVVQKIRFDSLATGCRNNTAA